MRILLLIVTGTLIASAHAEPIADRDRAVAAQQQAAQQRQVDRARERCIANRGTDCDTLDGLQEWILQDRSRSDAVLDRISPPSASSGASVPGTAAPGVPQLSPRNVP